MADNNTALFEKDIREDLLHYLQGLGVIDTRVPECPDVESEWDKTLRVYMPDGVREFQGYPIVSLGWMMFYGMAMAWYWDSDWERYSACGNLYEATRDIRGFDNMDEAILEDILGLKGDMAERTSSIAGECASRVYSRLCRERIEPGTTTAMNYYMASLHQLYLAGMAMQLNAMGYHMTRL